MGASPNLKDLDPDERRNALLLVATQTSSKLADILSNPKTVLTWLMIGLGAPPFLTGLLVPIRESGSMLPQAFISGLVKKVRRRKWVYLGGAIGQAVSLLIMAVAALSFSGAVAGWTIVAGLIFFAFARCLCSIASKDVLGKVARKGTRGRISGAAAAFSGLIGLGAALVVLFGVKEEASPSHYTSLLACAAVLFLLAGFAFVFLKEEESEQQTGALWGDLKARLQLVWKDPVLRHFVIARSLLLGSALASPYLVLLAQGSKFDLRSLAAFVVAGGLASALSSFLWGSLSDTSSRKAMALGGLIAGVIGLVAIGIALWVPSWSVSLWTWPTLFFLMHIGYSGVRVGRKTYIVDVADGNQRTDYVSASNTLIAIIILILGAIGSAIQIVGSTWALAFFSLLCLAGVVFVTRLQPATGGE